MKTVSVIVFYLLFSCPASARRGHSAYEEDFKAFTGGLAAGLNFSQVDGDRYFGYHKPGLTAGVFVTIHFNEAFSVQAELLYSQKGSHGNAVIESPFAGTSVSQCHIGLSYAEMPVLFQYRYKSFTAEAGGSYAVLVGTNEWILEPQALYIDKTASRFNATDLNCIFGLSRRLYKQWHANIRFQYSLIPIRPYERIPAGYGYGTGGQFNNLFSLRLTYRL